ncbi:major facilitator superfamily domain-containing protein [Pholiota molesta]|nr:major facilitator superfamily domain-containing protein [Pholiota molesta]
MATTSVLEESPSKNSESALKDEFSLYSSAISKTTDSTPTERRFVGIVALVFLNIVAAMSWPWFGPIANDTAADFRISLDQVNWLGNICQIGAVALILSAWIRYAGTARSLSPNSAYALLIIGQFCASIAQPIYQVIGPKYSETWFDLKGRTTATMIIAISNPFGGAIGQLISPLVATPRQSILVLGILSTAVTPLVFLIQREPPTPPTYAGSKKSPSLLSLCRAMLGYSVEPAARMSKRERVDFGIVVSLFAVPYGYSSDESGFMGACLLLSGMAAAIISGPVFDRVFTHHLAVTSKCFVPFAAAGWFVLIWAVRPHNTAALFVIMAIIGIGSIPMLAVGMELACELTRNADSSSAIIWFSGNLATVALILSAFRAGLDASPPLNMHTTLIFQGIIILVVCCSVFFLKGIQKRKAADEEKIQDVLLVQRAPNIVPS